MTSDDDGAAFAAMFKTPYGVPNAANKVHAGNRLKAERRAARTPAQRARRAVRVVQVNIRASQQTKDRLDALAVKLGCSGADVFDRAIAMLATAEGVP